MMSHDDQQVLSYGLPWAIRPRVVKAVGITGVVLGCVQLLGNAFIAAAIFKQLLKQGTGRGAVSPSLEPLLLMSGAEAAVSAALGGVAMLAGAAILYRSKSGVRSLRLFAWIKLPLALLFSVWAGWAMALFVSGRPWEIIAAAVAALLLSAAYPVCILRIFAKERPVAESIGSAGGVHA